MIWQTFRWFFFVEKLCLETATKCRSSLGGRRLVVVGIDDSEIDAETNCIN